MPSLLVDVERGSSRKPLGRVYWLLAGTLVAAGTVTLFSVGMALVLVGGTLVALGPLRDRPTRFWPPLVGVLAFILGYAAVAPLWCVTEAVARVPGSSPAPAASTTCSSLTGLQYLGLAPYHPPLWPALLAGVGLGALAGTGTGSLLLKRVLGKRRAADPDLPRDERGV